MTPLGFVCLALAATACLAGGLLGLAYIVSWPDPPGRVIAGYLPARLLTRRPRAAAGGYALGDVAIRTRGLVVADLVVARPDGSEEVLVSGRSIEEAAELYREVTGMPWTRETAERAAASRSAA